MKIHNTKSASRSFITKPVLMLFAILLAFAVPLQIMIKDAAACNTAASCQSEINKLQAEIDAYSAESSKLAAKSVTLQSTLSSLQNQISVIQAQLDLTQAKYDQLVIQIANTEQKIEDNQDALGTTIANMYVEDKVTPIEMLASSNNVGDYLDRQEYRTSVRNELTSTINDIKDLKVQLDIQKEEVSLVLIDQRNIKSDLESKQRQQQQLLDETKGQEYAYQELISDRQAAMLEAQNSWNVINMGGTSDYTLLWNDEKCWMTGYYSNGGADGNGGDGHGYGCRQCASYAIWRVAMETRNYSYKNLTGWGDAVNFPSGARGLFDQGSTPKAGSLAVMDAITAGNYNYNTGYGPGHVVWVERVNDDGTTLIVSQYNANIKDNSGNYIGYGNYSMVKILASKFFTYIYIK